MTTAKPKYTGDGAWVKTGDFTDALKSKLRAYYPQQDAQACPHFGHPADEFVNKVLAAARPSIANLMRLNFGITKQELRAEHADILNHLETTRDNLRKLSLTFSLLLDIEADPLGVADTLDSLICQMADAATRIDELPKNQRPNQGQHDIAVGMAICVSSVLNTYGIKVSATHGSYTRMVDMTKDGRGTGESDYTSEAVKILKAIGDDIKLVFAESTWRDLIIEAKSEAKKAGIDIQ